MRLALTDSASLRTSIRFKSLTISAKSTCLKSGTSAKHWKMAEHIQAMIGGSSTPRKQTGKGSDEKSANTSKHYKGCSICQSARDRVNAAYDAGEKAGRKSGIEDAAVCAEKCDRYGQDHLAIAAAIRELGEKP